MRNWIVLEKSFEMDLNGMYWISLTLR